LKLEDRAVFLFGFAKSARDNIGPDDLADLRNIGGVALALPDKALRSELALGNLIEVDCNV
jgi:hypothetical protein